MTGSKHEHEGEQEEPQKSKQRNREFSELGTTIQKLIDVLGQEPALPDVDAPKKGSSKDDSSSSSDSSDSSNSSDSDDSSDSSSSSDSDSSDGEDTKKEEIEENLEDSNEGKKGQKIVATKDGMAATLHVPAVVAPAGSYLEEAKQWGLDESIIKGLEKSSISRFFPIQREVIPALLRAESAGGWGDLSIADVCVTAPTGSGKTLVYALPVLHSIATTRKLDSTPTSAMTLRRIHSLIVVPTRDLAIQVYETLTDLARFADIQISVLIGQAPFTAEQASLVPTQHSHLAAPSSHSIGASSTTAAQSESLLRNGYCRSDVIIATPGRLVEHLEGTSGFAECLSFLRLLVIDEADRLLAQAYHSWVAKLNAVLFPHHTRNLRAGRSFTPGTDLPAYTPNLQGAAAISSRKRSRLLEPVPNAVAVRNSRLWTGEGAGVAAVAVCLPHTRHPSDGQTTNPLERLRESAAVGFFPKSSSESEMGPEPSPVPIPFRRILCSATFTANPQKLGALGLRNPVHFVSDADVAAAVSHGRLKSSAAVEILEKKVTQPLETKFVLPSTLHQVMTVCEAGEKAIAVLHLLRALEDQTLTKAPKARKHKKHGSLRALIFANTVDTAHRLTRLLQLYGGLRSRVAEFSASLPQAKRNEILKSARKGDIGVLVVSDAASRGLDLPNLPCVIHYDPATEVKTYVHRVGRSARAGRIGCSYAILRPEQARHFREMLTQTRPLGGRCMKETLRKDLIPMYAERLTSALTQLKNVLQKESTGEVNAYDFVEPLEF